MRFFEITSTLRIPMSSEEQTIMNKIENGVVFNDALDEREQEVARNMVIRGILNRRRKNGKICFKPNKEKLKRD